jgi:transcriptional repressor NrdR
MRCPFCKGFDSQVLGGGVKDGGDIYRRRRKCLNCGRRWSTHERIRENAPRVRHRDGRIEEFDGAVLSACLGRHCAKLHIPLHCQGEAADRLLDRLRASDGFLSTEAIADVMMETLLELHPIASLRFETEWRRPQNAADMLEIVWQFADRNGLVQRPKKVTCASKRRSTVRKTGKARKRSRAKAR